MNKVMIITYWYPPKKTIGTLRLSKWVKYLPEFGWKTVVVTVKPLSDLYTRYGTLPDEMKQGRVYRTRDRSLNELIYYLSKHLPFKSASEELTQKNRGRNFLFNRFAYWIYRQFICFPDECWPWLLEYRQIEHIAQKEQPDVLLSSSLPNTCHVLASLLNRKFNIPWVADFRDLWTQNHIFRRILPLRYLEILLERHTLKYAIALITVSEALKTQLEKLHKKPTYVIPNGFDPDDFSKNSSGPSREGPLVIVYTGSIYPEKRDPTPLFEAMHILLQRREINPSDIRIDFFGRRLETIQNLLERYPNIRPMVRLMGEVPYKDSLQIQRTADVLLLLEWTDPQARGVYTGKVFEYLGAGRPILSIGPKKGVIEALLKETQAGVHVQSATEILPLLKHWLKEKRLLGSPRFIGVQEAIQRYSRREQARQLAEVLDKVRLIHSLQTRV